jgi:hypothetical protein
VASPTSTTSFKNIRTCKGRDEWDSGVHTGTEETGVSTCVQVRKKDPNEACGKQNVALVTKIPAAPSTTSAAETNFQPRRGHRLWLGTQNRLIRAKCAVTALCVISAGRNQAKKSIAKEKQSVAREWVQ